MGRAGLKSAWGARAPRWIALWFAAMIAAAVAINWVAPKWLDFISFWAAAQLIGGNPYDVAAHAAVEATAGATPDGLLPFVHPPPFLLLIAPFGLVGYGLAFALWVAATGGLYWLAARRFAAFAHPAVAINGLLGQTAFLTSALFIGGFRALDRRPLLAGAMLGCLVIKPQLGVLLPVALVAGRQWRAVAGAALSSGALVLAALAAFGWEAFAAFGATLAHLAMDLGRGAWAWNEPASTYALARFLGASASAAAAVHWSVAALATVLCWRAWRQAARHKVATLAAATLLIPPYLFSYDHVLLVVPLHVLWARRRAVAALVWGLSALALGELFKVYSGPNPLPLAALICLVTLARMDAGTKKGGTEVPPLSIG
jgi:hypothetical protein